MEGQELHQEQVKLKRKFKSKLTKLVNLIEKELTETEEWSQIQLAELQQKVEIYKTFAQELESANDKILHEIEEEDENYTY